MQSWKNLFFSSLKNRSAAPPNLLKGFHSTSYKRSNGQKDAPMLSGQPRSSASGSWRSYALPGALLGGVGGLVLILHYNDERRAIPKGQGVKLESTNQGPIIGSRFSLINEEGKPVTEQSFLGNWVLLYFGYTHSPEVGPAEVRKMVRTIDILEGSKPDVKILPVFVTIDPQRDTPSQLRAYLREFDPRIVGLTGPASAVRQITHEYRVFFKKVDEEEEDDYLVESSENTYLLNPKMEVVRCFGVEYSAELLADEIERETGKETNAIQHH
ncbi:unnamed protein product [Cuscuta campestris]|uniref:Thioredoxin domain-containing protein n=1 Tax=Cuscuta campestris TaxID=132261 RepID=A0A484LFB2_9ASTE|nr:unnamed protein product [Cuscuta campestris]